ncbi:immunity 51 family protein [Flavobacterium panacagri]|uniref:immunity 51 family protein n=1 Tax=Flavobacterium panacagri TaxID=3034146 RepID=UPI0025A6209E|nr:immunity 51 family protein [Flavobacterium panacagri]
MNLIAQLNEWYELDEHNQIIHTLEGMPEKELTFELKGHLGRAYNNDSAYDKALKILLSESEKGAEDALWNFRVGYAYYCQYKQDKALPYFKKSALLGDNTAKSWVNSCEKDLESASSLTSNMFLNNMDTNNFNESIKPFFWVEHGKSVSVCLNVGQYKIEIFQSREEEGFEGNGYDWGSLATVFLEEQKPELREVVKLDPEGSMFCAYSSDADALKKFILSFKEACENDSLIRDLFSRAELD